LFTSPVGRIDAIDSEKAEQSGPLVAEMLDETAVGIVGMSLFEEQVEALADVDHGGGTTFDVAVPSGEGLEQQILDPPGRATGPGRGVLDHLVTPPDQVSDTGLMCRLLIAVVDDPVITDDGPGVVGGYQVDGLVEAPAPAHVVDGGVVGGRHPQPGALAADPPVG